MGQKLFNQKWLMSPAYAIVLLLAVSLVFTQFLMAYNGISLSAIPVPAFFADFHAFYTAGILAQQGHYGDAYHAADFLVAQNQLVPGTKLMTWNYPPQFGLIVSLLPLVSVGVAYGLFMVISSGAFLITFRQLAGKYWAVILLAGFPALLINFAGGQNGFLTGFLVAIFCLLLPRRPQLAGIPLGLMCIKPHLVLGIGIYLLFSKEWKTLSVAFLVALATSLLATVILSWSVWEAFYSGFEELNSFMVAGHYKFFRMTSAYAFTRSIGFSHHIAIGLQLLSALIATVLIWQLVKTSAYDRREKLGFVLLLSLLFSPYIYDYDQLILLISLALLLPYLKRSRRFIILLLGAVFAFTAIGLIARWSWASASDLPPGSFLAPAAPMLWTVMLLLWLGIPKQSHNAEKMPSELAVL